jgi:hypothetical protein
LGTIKEEEEEISMDVEQNVNRKSLHISVGTVSLLAETDKEFRDFLERKETLLNLVGDISRVKFKDEPKKQNEMIDLARDALWEEVLAF